MAFSGGVFDRLYNWATDRDTGVKIRADKMDLELDGMATGLSQCVLKDGTQTITDNITLSTYKLTEVGDGNARNQYLAIGQFQDGETNWVDGGGTADSITASYTPTLTALVDGMLLYVRATAANTGAVDFDPGPGSALAVTKFGGTALVAGDIVGDGHELILRYELANTRWELLNPAPTAANLGLVIGTNVQAHDAQLDSIAALSGLTDTRILRTDGTDGLYQESGWTIADTTDLMTAAGDVQMGDNSILRAELADTGELYLGKGNLGATPIFDFSLGHAQSGTVDQEITSSTFAATWPASGTAGSFTLELINGNAFAISWPTPVKWAGGSPPTFTTSGTDFITFYTRDGGTTVHAFLAGLDMS